MPPAPVRSSRYSGLFSLALTDAVIIGCGGLGAILARTLATMGIRSLRLVDPDIVQEVNLGTQGYGPSQLNTLKVDALTSDIAHLNPSCLTTKSAARFSDADLLTPNAILFSCVDSISTRASIWRTIRGKTPLFIDLRASAKTCRIICAPPALYSDTLFPPAEALAEPCTARFTYHNALQAAAFAIQQLTNHLTFAPVEPDTTIALSSAEMFPTPRTSPER